VTFASEVGEPELVLSRGAQIVSEIGQSVAAASGIAILNALASEILSTV
jgi:hypothetical protein